MTVAGDAPPGSRARRVLLRTAFLLTGAALFLAFALLQTGMIQVVRQTGVVPLWVAVPVVVAPLLLLGLLPGVREVEVAAARSLLGVRAELVTPEHLRAEHRWRSAVWVTLHVVLGGAAGTALVVGLPGLATEAPGLVGGRRPGWWPAAGAPGPLLGLLLVLLGAAVLVAAVGAAGAAMSRWAPWFLGPTWHDRLLLAEDRLAREAEHQRLARELHDGIGHALSLISLQAVAGRRVVAAEPARAEASLQVIEETARAALDDLDSLLGSLRDGPASRRPTPGIDDLGRLVASHRALGLQLDAELDPRLDGAALPSLVSSTVHQVAAEALANAARYGPGAPVRLRVGLAPGGARGPRDPVAVTTRAPDGTRGRRTGGRGLRGMAERVDVLGGTMAAGPDAQGRWVVAVELPVPEPS